MEAERLTVAAALNRLLVSPGYSVIRKPGEHADGKSCHAAPLDLAATPAFVGSPTEHWFTAVRVTENHVPRPRAAPVAPQPACRNLKRIALQILEIGGIPSALRRANVSNIHWRLLCEYGQYMIVDELNLRIQ